MKKVQKISAPRLILDNTSRIVFDKSDTLGIDVDKQLVLDAIKQPPCSLSREIDDLKLLVKAFTESFLNQRKQYKEYRVYIK